MRNSNGYTGRKGESKMPKNPKETSPKVAKKASKQLRDKESTKDEKSVAGSDLGQTAYKKKKQ